MEQKARLNYEISQIKIAKNYSRSNADHKDCRDLSSLCKMLGKRLGESRNLRILVKSLEVKEINAEVLSQLKEFVGNCCEKLEVPGELVVVNEELESGLRKIICEFRVMEEKYQAKGEEFFKNQYLIAEVNEQRIALSQLEKEVGNYIEEIEFFKKGIAELENKKVCAGKARKSVDKIKIFHQLSDDALKLRSKLLLQKELSKDLQNAEEELEDLQRKVSNQQDSLKHLQRAFDQDTKASESLTSDLSNLHQYIKTTEKKLQSLNQLKTIYTHSIESRKKNLSEEGKVLYIDYFTQIHNENLSLTEQSEKLKKRISRLSTSKS